jgi:hypothetical protein
VVDRAPDTSTAEDLVSLSGELLDDIDDILESNSVEDAKFVLEGLDDIKPLTLADLIREGSQMNGQAFGAFVVGEGTCALGAAYKAAEARGLV